MECYCQEKFVSVTDFFIIVCGIFSCLVSVSPFWYALAASREVPGYPTVLVGIKCMGAFGSIGKTRIETTSVD